MEQQLTQVGIFTLTAKNKLILSILCLEAVDQMEDLKEMVVLAVQPLVDKDKQKR